ncbi:DUF1874 domain-containing protein [Caldisphaera sp.]|uniref:STIV orfB116 family protein n=1 Tax=Caldisphaera sp. TaxID=2060322 RepID=UPI0025BC4E1C|nr:DUF1874 domain-containing protein [Caldisphaera sp.]
MEAKAQTLKKYICNTFSLSMVGLENGKKGLIAIEEISKEQFCKAIKDKDIINALGHQGTVDIINSLCGTNFSVNRIEIKLYPSDIIYVLQIMVRLPEGKVLNAQEMEELYSQGKIRFFKVYYYQQL